jgi:hypothetical protein
LPGLPFSFHYLLKEATEPIYWWLGGTASYNPSLFDPSPARNQIGRPDDQGFVAGNYSGMRHSPMALIMPDGKVLVHRGSTSDQRYSAGLDRDAVLVPEEFDPA